MATPRSLLAQLTAQPLARACDEPWERMRGDDRVRRCAACARDVFDVSAMSAREAELRLLNAGVATPCIRTLRRSDGSVVHAPEPVGLRPTPPRTFVAAAALGVTISAAAFADEAPRRTAQAPPQCVAYTAPELPASGTAAFAAAPPAEPTPPPPDRPIPLAGEPMRPEEQPHFGTLVLKSKVARTVTIVGIELKAPLASYLLTPGDFSVAVHEPSGKLRQVRFKISKDKKTVVDLDKR